MSHEQFIDGNPEGPHIFIQWKGTDVCADIHCSCGEHGHIDDDFMYYVRCPKCGTTFEVGCHVALRPVSPETLGAEGVSPYTVKTWGDTSDE